MLLSGGAKASKVGLKEIYNSARDNNDPQPCASSWNCTTSNLDIAGDARRFTTCGKTTNSSPEPACAQLREGNTIVEVSDGIMFPILASFSGFAVRTPRAGLSSHLRNLRMRHR